MPGNVPDHILALVEGAETAPSVTALSNLLQKRGFWYMSPGVVRATCEMLEEEGSDIAHVPRGDATFLDADITNPETLAETVKLLEELYKKVGAQGLRLRLDRVVDTLAGV